MRILVCPEEPYARSPMSIVPFTTKSRCIWCGEPLDDHDTLEADGLIEFERVAARTGTVQDEAVRRDTQ